MDHIQRTLVVLKPDVVQRGIVGEIMTRLERAGLKIVGMKMVVPSAEQLHKHYEEIGTLISRHGHHVYQMTMAQLAESPVVAIALEGIDAVEHVRKMVGATNPKEAQPGTIRGDYTHISRPMAIEAGRTLPNLIHASANKEEAAQELALWFGPDETFEYKMPYEHVVHGHVPEATSDHTE